MYTCTTQGVLNLLGWLADEKPGAAVHLFVMFFHFSAVAKNKEVQLCIVHCQMSVPLKSTSKRSFTKRSCIQECYRRAEIWSLKDLTLIDGRNPDVVISQILL